MLTDSKFVFQENETCGAMYATCIFDEMAAECKIKINSAADVLSSKESITEHFKLELNFLRNRPVAFETQNNIFVHSGMPQKTIERMLNHD